MTDQASSAPGPAIRHDHHEGVSVVTIDRPDRRNAVDSETLRSLLGALRSALDEARVLVLTGAGGHFCAGADLTTVEDEGFRELLRTVLEVLREASIPTMAAIEGAALGAGTQFAAACDLRCATADATFGVPAGRLGVMVDMWTVQMIAEEAGQSLARAMLVGDLQISGAAAHAAGFVQRQGGRDEAMAWARDLAQRAPLSLAGHKLMLNRLRPELDVDMGVMAAYQAAWSSQDLQEGLTAFRERRRPVFRGQ